MGARKYIYLAFLAGFLLKYYSVHRANENYDYRWQVPDNRTVAILTYGDGVPPSDLAYARKVIEQAFGMNTEVIQRPNEELTQFYQPQFKQYHAGNMLNHVARNPPSEHFRHLVLLHSNIYDDGTNFIFGLSANPGPVSVVTTKGYAIAPKDISLEPVLHKKVLRVLLVHELGHSLGLDHCENKCAMKFGNNVIHEMKKHDRFCAVCESKLKQLSHTGFQGRRL